MILSGTRTFAGRWAVFGRWTKSFDRLSADYRELFSLGAGWLAPFGRGRDFIGIGAFAADPSARTRGIEWGFEINYRVQLTQAMSVMPDLQCWFRDDPSGEKTRTVVGGARVNFEF